MKKKFSMLIESLYEVGMSGISIKCKYLIYIFLWFIQWEWACNIRKRQISWFCDFISYSFLYEINISLDYSEWQQELLDIWKKTSPNPSPFFLLIVNMHMCSSSQLYTLPVNFLTSNSFFCAALFHYLSFLFRHYCVLCP